MSKMIGKCVDQPYCGHCCGVRPNKGTRVFTRATKRSERNRMRAALANRTDY